MSDDGLAPWLQAPWERLGRVLQSGRVPHALLLSGPSGLGLERLGERLARALLCEAPAEDQGPCGSCRSCALAAAGTHPDLRTAEPEEDSPTTLKVEAVRQVAGFVGLSSHYRGRRVVLMDPADAMTVSAANALLKTLEEPPAGAVLVLVTRRPSALLPTIRSRCQQVTVAAPCRAAAVAWLAAREVAHPENLLALAGGGPLDALALHAGGEAAVQHEVAEELARLAGGGSDPVATAARWENQAEQVVETVARLAPLLVRAGAGDCDASRSLPDERLRKIAGDLDWMRVLGFVEQAFRARRARERSLNARLMLEDLLVGWCRATRG